MNKTKIESLVQNAPTCINVESIDEALKWVEQLQEDVRSEMMKSLHFKEDVTTDQKNKIRSFIKMWTPPIRYAVNIDLNNHVADELCISDVKIQLAEIRQELSEFRNESAKFHNQLLRDIDKIFTLVREIIKKWAEKIDKSFLKKMCELSKHNVDLDQKLSSNDTENIENILNVLANQNNQGTCLPQASVTEPSFMLKIEDAREQIERNMETWLSDFMKLVQYQYLKPGVTIDFILKYLYDTIDESEHSHTQDRIIKLLTKYFGVELVEYGGQYQSADIFDFASNPELAEAVTTKKALLHDGKLLYKGMVVHP